jgi:salicylate hydroxylase
MQPHLGAGVGQGFEDVYVLCRLLTHPSTKLSNLDASSVLGKQ